MLTIEQDQVLAIEPECYRRWLEIARAHIGDSTLMEQLRSPAAAARLVPPQKQAGDVAVINLAGFMEQKPSLFTMLFGGTSTEQVAKAVVAALADSSIGAVVLNIDSPGGSVSWVPEAAALIRSARGSKPLIAVANPLMASAAYYLASQADEIVATPSALVGSVGVYTAHVDQSAALDKMGINVTEITHGRRKAEESSARPLTEEARASMQERVDFYGRLFEQNVAKGRGVTPATVRANFGEGAIFTSDRALAAGLIDRVATLDQVLAGLVPKGRKVGTAASVAAARAEMAAWAAVNGIPREN